MQAASRIQHVKEYYFSAKLREIATLNAGGLDVINLGIGSPDLPPHPDVISELASQSIKPGVHAYQSYKGIPAFREAISDWYGRSYGFYPDPGTEILPLLGSKEGIMHICMTYLEAGDVALVPNPGYPAYATAVKLAGATPLSYRLEESNQWFPDLAAIEKTGLGRVKLMFINYPHMPTGQLPTHAVFEELVAFAAKHRILLVHDNPYSFILNSEPMSILAIPGAPEVAIELNSLSKSHNMAGWRIGMVVGKEERINEIMRFKTNMDSGMFLPVQLAAVKAMALEAPWYSELNKIYAQRKVLALELLDLIGSTANERQAGIFLWAKIAPHYRDAYHMTDELLKGARVFITPGGVFGEEGMQYLRLSLCTPVERIQEAIHRIKSSSKLKSIVV